ncbi:hypothetical protein FIBSPDRAFT_897629 [Athelia psychrophila]|uniref:Uncharacterized protein n=1 Tax=Athelia psychrophila TaxID=1759441 RepID=A0A166BZ33_9AGAM|nr:hypothetical protein FIBSPDRAFT_897629 [Fibularhizoctonia sp. CBS 109695]
MPDSIMTSLGLASCSQGSYATLCCTPSVTCRKPTATRYPFHPIVQCIRPSFMRPEQGTDRQAGLDVCLVRNRGPSLHFICCIEHQVELELDYDELAHVAGSMLEAAG